MKISTSEKLLFLMLSEIYDQLGLTSFDTKLLRSAIYTDNTWALDWEIAGIKNDDGEAAPPIVQEVVDYLSMWSFLEEKYDSFDSTTKEKIAFESKVFGKHVRFPGFDGNNESKALSIARILIEDMGRFERFKGRDLNSHAPLISNYNRMLKSFNSMDFSFMGTRTLRPEQMIKILLAMRNSDEQ